MIFEKIRKESNDTPAEDEQDFYAYEITNQCATCGHLNRSEPTTCAAFPHGIPVGILMGVIDHNYFYNYGGVTDHGLRYVPMDGPAPAQVDLFAEDDLL